MNIAILTSGGDSPGMNVAIRSAVRYALKRGHKIYGVTNGYRGLYEGEIFEMNHKSVSGVLSMGGTFLKTARMKDFKEKDKQLKAIDNLKKYDIDSLIVIGGDGSYRGAKELYELGIKTIGIPGTIDNDIYGTDFTLGFNTAVETIVDAIDKLRDTSQSHQRCSIIEVMGRKCGDLALYSAISGGAEFIITPEHQVDKKTIIDKLKQYKLEDRTHAIVVVTENMFDVHEFANEIEQKSKFSSRATVLGYIQRGGSPSPEDRILGSKMGAYAIDLLERDIGGVGIGVRANQMTYLPFEIILNNERDYNPLYELIEKIS